MEGKVFNKHRSICYHVVKIKPIAHHYEEPGEPEYIKYGCPVCESLGERFSITEGTRHCPSCGVNLLWEM